MHTVSIDECLESYTFWTEGGFVDLGPEYVVNLGPDCDTVPPATPSPTRARGPMPRRRFQKGRVFPRGNSWCGSYWDYPTAQNGLEKPTRRTPKLGPKTLSERSAWKRLQPYLDAVNQANIASAPKPKSDTKLRDFIHEWREQKAVHQRIGSKRAIDSHLRAHIIPRLGDVFLVDINTQTVQGFITNLSGGERSEKTIRNILQTLGSAIEWAPKLGYPTGEFRKGDIELSGRESEETRFLDAGEMAKTIAKAKEPYATMFTVLAMAAPRPGEMLALQSTSLDFERGLIHVRHTLDDRTRTLQPTKTKASRNTVPMPPQLAARLKNFLSHHRRGNSTFLFTNRNGNPYSLGKVKEYGLWPAQDAAGIKRTGLHAFRRGHSSELLEAGTAPGVVQRQLRHSDARVTLEHYSHVVGDAHRFAVNGLADLIEQQINQVQLESGS